MFIDLNASELSIVVAVLNAVELSQALADFYAEL